MLGVLGGVKRLQHAQSRDTQDIVFVLDFAILVNRSVSTFFTVFVDLEVQVVSYFTNFWF